MPEIKTRNLLCRHVMLAAVGALLLGLAACYPGGPESGEDTDLVVTVQSPAADYTDLQTFVLEDKVYDLTPPDTDPDPIPQDVKDLIIGELRSQMVAAGFVDVSADSASGNYDVWMLVGSVQSEVWFTYYGWGGWWGGGWYYPPYTNVGSFDVGTVIWQLADNRGRTPGEEPDSIWLAALNGALSNSNSTNTTRLTTNIDQAFRQSPYIQARPATP